MQVSARDVVAVRMVEYRRRRGLSAQALAQRCTELGAPQISRSFVANLESRRRGLSVDDLLVLALALDVAPLALLSTSSEEPEELRVTDTVSIPDPQLCRAWLAGESALPESNARLYYGIALERMRAPDGQAMSAFARAVVQEQHRDLAAQYERQALDLLNRTRTQALELVDDVAAVVAAGATTEDVLSRLAQVRTNIVQQAAPTTVAVERRQRSQAKE